MSYYSHALNAAITKDFDGKQSILSTRAGVPTSLISRHCSGNFRPDIESLNKICRVMAPDASAQVAAAHLHDEIPPVAKDSIQITVRNGTRTNYALNDASRPPAFARLDPKTQRALEILAEEALDNEHARDAIRSTALFLSAGDLDRSKNQRQRKSVVPPVNRDKLNES